MIVVFVESNEGIGYINDLQFDVYSIGRIGLLTKLNDDRKCKIK